MYKLELYLGLATWFQSDIVADIHSTKTQVNLKETEIKTHQVNKHSCLQKVVLMMKFKILTIDDSQVIRKIIRQSFDPYNCSVFEGSNGQEGLEVALEVQPDLIILDIDMPVMNGWDTLASIRFDDELKNTPVIMLTANAEEKNEHRAEVLGVANFIKKPFRSGDLIQIVGNHIALTSQ